MYNAIMFFLFYFLLTHLIFYLIFLKKMLPKNSFIGHISIDNMKIIIKWYSSVPLQTFYNPVR